MDVAQKEAIAKSQRQTHAVRNYLELLNEHPVSLYKRLDSATSLQRLVRLDEIGERTSMAAVMNEDVLELLDLHAEKVRIEAVSAWEGDLATAEENFVEHAHAYAKRKNVPYEAWLTMNVSEEVLERAEIYPDW
jgi:hypothetical protein